jgi:hypothetical protein
MSEIEVVVAAALADVNVYWDAGGATWGIFTANTAARTGFDNANRAKRGGGFRFANVGIPKYSTITNAYLEITAAENLSNDNVNTVIVGELTANASLFSDLADYQSRRGTICGGANDDNITNASVNWNSIAHWTQNTKYQSPDISTIIQEIVDLSAWEKGNAIVIFWDDHAGNSDNNDDTYRSGYAYSGDSSKTVKLHVEFYTQIFHYLLGSISLINKRVFEYLFGNAEMVNGRVQYLLGDPGITNGHADYLYGSPNVIYGNAGYIYVVPTIVSRIPKPIYGRVYQRLSAVEKEVN